MKTTQVNVFAATLDDYGFQVDQIKQIIKIYFKGAKIGPVISVGNLNRDL